jgi:hypothetical protein
VVAGFGAADHAGAVEDAEVLGDVLLGGAQCLLELSDGRRSFAEAIEQLDAHRLAEHAKTLCDELDQRLGKRVRNRREFHHQQHRSTNVQWWS